LLPTRRASLVGDWEIIEIISSHSLLVNASGIACIESIPSTFSIFNESIFARALDCEEQVSKKTRDPTD
jgi:hypothetical protein